MHTWFECKIKYEKLDENGLPKKVTEPYLVDALSYAEAEQRIIKEMEPYISGEFQIVSVVRKNYSELFIDNNSADRFFEAKVVFVVADMEKGTEKRVNASILVYASDIKDALNMVEKGMKGTLNDYVIVGLKETQIMDIYPYEPTESH